jgi:uncharacterized iron-regulated protein
VAHSFEDLVKLERAAVDAHAQLPTADDYDTARQTWLAAAVAFQAAVTETAGDTSRVELEMAVKKAVRHPEPA